MTVQLYIRDVLIDDALETRWDDCPACVCETPSRFEGATVVHRYPHPTVKVEEDQEAGSTSPASSKPRARKRHAGQRPQPGRRPS